MLYARLSDGTLVTYQGMTQETIVSMLSAQGLTCQFLSQSEFQVASAQ